MQAFLYALLVLAVPALPAATTTAPWEGAPFSADPAEILSASVPTAEEEGSGILVLLKEETFVFDDDGRVTWSHRLVYRVLTGQNIGTWAAVNAEWEPWHQHRPEIRARTITTDGAAHDLNPSVLGEYTASEMGPELFGDRRALRGPLPAIAEGTVVEELVTVRDHEPLFPLGTARQVFLGESVPIRTVRLTIDVPDSFPLRHEVRLIPDVRTERREADGRIRLTLEAGPVQALEAPDPFLPSDVPFWPHVEFSTAGSWAELAATYAQVVDERIAGSDLGKIARKLPDPRRGAMPAIEEAVRRLHREVRYTGVEFGAAALLPQPPAETLALRHGDCKDQATLLVAMLRGAGLESHVALLASDFGPDVDPDLPGIEWFNHAIVHVQGDEPIWIDTTDPYTPPGELPLMDQGRWALVASSVTSELVRTPVAPSTENRTVETREFFLAEMGGARVLETTEAWGSIEARYRADFDGQPEDDMRRSLEEYARNAYLAQSLADFEVSDASDLSEPFRLRLTMDDVRVGMTDRSEAAVAISLSPLFERLPFVVLSYGAESGEDRRQSDLQFFEPHVVELRYVIHPPPGFTARPLPDSDVRELGRVRLTQDFSREGETVTAVLRLDSGARRHTPDEVMELATGLRELMEYGTILISFEQVGQALLAAGDVRGALAEFRELAKLHPREGLHRAQIAQALLAGGLGEAARREASAAVELEPGSSEAHHAQGWILQHDLLGRRFHPGWERSAALAALRKAKEANPADDVARAELAILLEHDETGTRYTAASDLDEAIEEYRALQDERENHRLDENLLVALLWAGRYDEARTLAEELPATPNRNAGLLLARAGADRTQEAIRRAPTLVPDPNVLRAAYVQASQILVTMRRYADAADMLQAAARGAPQAAQLLARAEQLRGVRRLEDLPPSPDDPGGIVRRFFLAMFDDRADGRAEILPLLSEAVRKGEDPDEALEGIERGLRAARAELLRQGITLPVVRDLFASLMRVHVSGDDGTGYRVRVEAGDRTQSVYVVKEGDAYRIAAVGPQPGEKGLYALRLADAGELAASKRWLNWALDDLPPIPSTDPFGGLPFLRFWRSDAEPERESLRVAAAALMASSPIAAAEAVPILQEARDGVEAAEDRLRFDWALTMAHALEGDLDASLASGRRLLAERPDSAVAFQSVVNALDALGRVDEARAEAEARLKQFPDEPATSHFLSSVAAREGRWDQVEAILRRLVDRGHAGSVHFNNLAWNALFRDDIGSQAFEDAQQAIRLEPDSTAGLHTLASLYAEVGRTSEAREVLLQAMDLEGSVEPASADWYVLGRIAEELGEHESAREMYARVMPVEGNASSTYSLARRRLGAKPRRQNRAGG